MPSRDFYTSESYRKKQSEITRLNWQTGKLDILRKRVSRACRRSGCKETFDTVPSDPKIFCSRRCSAIVSNTGQTMSSATKSKISLALTGRRYVGKPRVSPVSAICARPDCTKTFVSERWRHKKYCSTKCAMLVIGGRPTSPKAARAKAGIRPDISPHIYFFSRWEANFARLLTMLGIKWVHQPKKFRLVAQNYTPDFYLPEAGVFVEIKNFLADYSAKRDAEFRKLYPNEKLILILKDDYLDLQATYSPHIKEWEFS